MRFEDFTKTDADRREYRKAIEALWGKEILDDILETLKCYETCHIVHEWGKTKVSTMWGVTNGYAPDHFVSEDFHADDFYSPEERDANYLEVFRYHAYPSYVERAEKARNRRAG